MQAKVVACAVGVTRVNEPAVEMQEAPLGYEWAGLQAKVVACADGVTRVNDPAVEMQDAPLG